MQTRALHLSQVSSTSFSAKIQQNRQLLFPRLTSCTYRQEHARLVKSWRNRPAAATASPAAAAPCHPVVAARSSRSPPTDRRQWSRMWPACANPPAHAQGGHGKRGQQDWRMKEPAFTSPFEPALLQPANCNDVLQWPRHANCLPSLATSGRHFHVHLLPGTSKLVGCSTVVSSLTVIALRAFIMSSSCVLLHLLQPFHSHLDVGEVQRGGELADGHRVAQVLLVG